MANKRSIRNQNRKNGSEAAAAAAIAHRGLGDGFRDGLEAILDASRTYILTSYWIIVTTFAVSIVGICFSFVQLFGLRAKYPDLLYAVVSILVLILGFRYVVLKHIYQNVHRTSRNQYPNYFCAKKGVGLVLSTFALFIFLDSYLKGGDKFWSIVLCTSVFTFLVLLMVVFKCLEDYNYLANAFLYASFGLFMQVFTDPWHLVILTAVTAFLCAVKTILVEGESQAQRS